MTISTYRVRTPKNHPTVFVRLSSGQKIRLSSGCDCECELGVGDCDKIYSSVPDARISPVSAAPVAVVVEGAPVIASVPALVVDVGIMDVTFDSGDDGEFGTADDEVTVAPKSRKKSKKSKDED